MSVSRLKQAYGGKVEISTKSSGAHFPYARDVLPVTGVIYLVIYWACLGANVFAFVDALRRRPDAFIAVDRQTKQIWLMILGGSLLAQWLFNALSGGVLSILGFAAIVATLVYLVDVRRKLIDITNGPRW
jgi:hypothetical protein